jgi:hypothetical protein
MVPGGVTETIWHFAGYFHHIEEVMKDRFVYEQGGVHMRPDDYVLQLKDFLSKHDLDEFDTDRIPFVPPEFSSAQFKPFLIGTPRRLPEFEETDTDSDPARALAPRKSASILDGPVGGMGIGTPDISVTYQSGGEQLLLQIDQLNSMIDDDQLGFSSGSSVETLNQFDVDAALERLTAAAEDVVPEDLALSQPGTSTLAAFVVARDAAIAENGDTSPHSVEPGRYVNGVLTEPPPAETPEEVPTPGPDLALKGQWGMLGGNEATNAALIADLKEGSNTMIVLGDYFKTNAIVQSNSYIDNDDVNISSLSSGGVNGDGNTAENIGEFQQHAGVFPQGLFAGFVWNVDVVEGDFYDINLIVQNNLLRDNDIAVQETNQTHYEAHVGENEQFNLTQVVDGTMNYDLIIIGGNYHGANWIFQNNIILDPDIVKAAASGETAAVTEQSVAAGGNELVNDATIITYGDNVFAKPTEALQNVVTAIEAEQTTLGPDYGWFVPGNGSGLLNVLYVTGDYYDINAIWQNNIISDLDTAIQYLAPASSAETASDGTLTQSISTGGNQALNEAIIVDVGAASTFVAGDVYQDTILIQGNLVSENNDKITYGDPSALVPEIVAFTGEECPQEEVTDIRAPIVPDDTMASVMT